MATAVLPSCPFSSTCVTPGIARRTHPEGEPFIYSEYIKLLYTEMVGDYVAVGRRFESVLRRRRSLFLGSVKIRNSRFFVPSNRWANVGPQSLYLARAKNLHGHCWVCEMSMTNVEITVYCE